MAKAAELKTKLQELSKAIVENEDCTTETIDQAQETLLALKKYQLYASAQHRSHIPEFGSWERDNVRYTTYFENARIAKAAEKINPDDPEALLNPLEDLDSNQDRTHNDQKSTGSNKSIVSAESDSDKSNSSHLLRHSSQQRLVKSSEKKGSDEASNSFSQWAHGLSRPNERGAAVPKFGDWDERDPSSGEGFTAIFKKLEEEKQIVASGEVQAVPYSDLNNQTNSKPSSRKSMMFCCLLPSRRG